MNLSGATLARSASADRLAWDLVFRRPPGRVGARVGSGPSRRLLGARPLRIRPSSTPCVWVGPTPCVCIGSTPCVCAAVATCAGRGGLGVLAAPAGAAGLVARVLAGASRMGRLGLVGALWAGGPPSRAFGS
ncbi:hypothetical protein LK459_01455 [Gordonia otitidis]|uniref:hypothetical protein n=1 Tax=Gordonia otitidis TaxID=249058 RepID=UPI001D14BD8D|nr:hypothetical protein [Gordonia otitidis]UEA61779.1 hypothetical protein LK459_01455 [Gordonia otitidis]